MTRPAHVPERLYLTGEVSVGARVVVYACGECDWLIAGRSYKGQPGRADRVGQGQLRRHQRVAMHQTAFRWVGQAEAEPSEPVDSGRVPTPRQSSATPQAAR